jgi:hypothetical protein
VSRLCLSLHRNLCVEARRKHPELQTSAERALVKLRAIATGQSASTPAPGQPPKPAVEALQSESVLRPFLLACATKSAKLTTLALSSLQKLVSLTPLSARFLATIMGTLRIQAESEDQNVQLKILQTLLLTISPSSVECGELLQGSLLQALSICFRLFLQKKSMTIHHTAFAALRQVVTLLFDRVTWQSQNGAIWQKQAQAVSVSITAPIGSPDQPTPVATPAVPMIGASSLAALLPAPLDQLSFEAQNAYLLFQDLCILAAAGTSSTDSAAAAGGQAGGQPVRPKWLTNLSATIPPEVCIELLENILSSNHALFSASATPQFSADQGAPAISSHQVFFVSLVKQHLAPLLIRLMRSHFEFSIVLRLVRTIVVLVKHFHTELKEEVEMFLSLFIRMLSVEFPLWHRVIVLEAILQIFHLRGEKMTYWLYQMYDVAPQQGTIFMSGQKLHSSSASTTVSPPSFNPNQTKIFTSLLHALSKLIVQTGTALSDGTGGANLASGSLAVGSTGLSSTAALITHASAATPAGAAALQVSLTVPSESSATSGGSLLHFSALASSQHGRSQSGSEALNASSASGGGLVWRLYTAKGSRGLDLLGLEEGAPGAGQQGGPNSPAMMGGGGAMGGGASASSSSSNSSSSLFSDDTYVLTLAQECLAVVVAQYASFAKTNEAWGGASGEGVNGGVGQSDASTAASGDAVDLSTLRSMVNAGCLPILAALSFLLNKTHDESLIQHLLMSYQSFTNTAGVLELTRSRDTALQNLAGFALPRNGLSRDDPPSELMKTLFGTGNISTILSTVDSRAEFAGNLSKILLSPKNIQSLKALFNISHCLGRFLGNASWLTVLETFQTLDTIIHVSNELNYRLSRESAFTEMYQSLLPHQTEINIMAGALSRLFESTRYLDDVSVTHVLSALGTLSLSSLANAATSEGMDRSSAASALTAPTSGHASTLPHNVSSLPLNLAPPATIRMFALINLIATLEHNMFRITSARLWEIGIGHLTCVINHKDSQIRQYGVAALTKITILALSKPTTYQQGAVANTNSPLISGLSGSSAGGGSDVVPVKKLSSSTSKSLLHLSSLPPSEFPSYIQSSLLEPFSDLFRSKYEDTRENILMSVFQILQNSGQWLVKGGWKVVLAILQAVVSPNAGGASGGAGGAGLSGAMQQQQNGGDDSMTLSTGSKASATTPSPSANASASFIHVGFNSIQLITNDYLESIPFSSLAQLIQTIAAYCAQVSDTNISFTSIGLLWRVSDYMGRCAAGSRDKTSNGGAAVPRSGVADPSKPPTSGSPDSILTDQLADSLMHLVFTSLVTLCTDTRTEVRNSAVKTLHNTLVAHSPRMELDTCLNNLGGLVLPLLSRLLTERSLEENAAQHAHLNSTELGKDKTTGKSVMMLIHYSRDTAGKQWDETRVYALQGTARVVKGYTENLLRAAAAATSSSSSHLHETILPKFRAHWSQFLSLNLVALANRSPEVTLSALNAILDLMMLLFTSAGGTASGTTFSPPPLGSSSIASSSTSLLSSLWSPVLSQFYVLGTLHALKQHRYLEWLEEREKERKGGKGGEPPIDTSASPYPTASYGDSSSDDGWKSWLKTYTHLIANFQTLLTQAGRRMTEMGETGQGDIGALVQMSHVLTAVHAAYNDRRAAETFALKKANAAPGGAEPVMPDRKETPVQTAHLKLLEALTGRVETSSSTPSSSSNTPIPLSGDLWTQVFEQLLAYLLAEYGSTELTTIETGLQAILDPHGSAATGTTSSGGQTSITPPPSYSSGVLSPARPSSTNALKPSHGSLSRSPSMSLSPSSASYSLHTPILFPSSSFAKKLLRVFARCYTAAPGSVRARHFIPILLSLARILLSCSVQLHRSTGIAEMAEETVATMIQVMENGLQACGEGASAGVRREQQQQVWTTLVKVFSAFLAPPALPGSSLRPPLDYTKPTLLPMRLTSQQQVIPLQLQRLWETLQIALIGALFRIVLPRIGQASGAFGDGGSDGGRVVAEELVSLLNIGYDPDEENAPTTLSAIPDMQNGSNGGGGDSDSQQTQPVTIATSVNELLSHSCLNALFQLVRLGSAPDTAHSSHLLIASLSAPLLIHRCSYIFSSYLSLERIRPVDFPLPRCRREEMGFILRELATLEMEPAVTQALFETYNKHTPEVDTGAGKGAGGKNARPLSLGASGKRGHLLKLFPVLCQCITSVPHPQ